MQLKSILTPERTFCDASGASKKRVFQSIATALSEKIPQFSEEEIYEALLNREKLGSTAIGKGIAIPHSRIENCVKTVGALFKLSEPVQFNAPDKQNVDIVFVLLVPAEANDSHLQVLSELAQLFSDDKFTFALRTATNSEELFNTAIEEANKILGLRDSA